jgi:hypothetical protein
LALSGEAAGWRTGGSADGELGGQRQRLLATCA